jgi:23S rRNA U2552 (ribose-2'-O)-methylase RlmE/FtsJ
VGEFPWYQTANEMLRTDITALAVREGQNSETITVLKQDILQNTRFSDVLLTGEKHTRRVVKVIIVFGANYIH